MPEMKDSGIEWIGEIPNDWDISKIKFVADFEPTCNFENISPEDRIAYAPMECIKQGFYEARDALYEELSHSLTPFQNGDIVMAKVTPCFENGNIAIMNKLQSGIGLGSSELFVFRAKNIMAKYLFYWLQNSDFIQRACSTMTGVGGLKRVSPFFCKNCEIHIPPYNEQCRIADYLDRKCSQIDAIIARQQEVIEKLKAYKLSVITEAVTKGLNPNVPMKDSGIEWIGDVPEHWTESTILRNIRFEGGSQPPLENFIDEPREGYIRLIQNRDYRTDDYATYVPITMVSKFCTKEDVMIGRYGPPIFVIHRGLEGAYNVALMKAVPISIDREFMFFYLQNSTLLKYIESFSVRTAGQSGVNPNILKRYPMFIPPVEEQQQIAKGLLQKCHYIDNLIENKKNLVEKLMAYKKSLIYEVVTGKKEV